MKKRALARNGREQPEPFTLIPILVLMMKVKEMGESEVLATLDENIGVLSSEDELMPRRRATARKRNLFLTVLYVYIIFF